MKNSDYKPELVLYSLRPDPWRIVDITNHKELDVVDVIRRLEELQDLVLALKAERST